MLVVEEVVLVHVVQTHVLPSRSPGEVRPFRFRLGRSSAGVHRQQRRGLLLLHREQQRTGPRLRHRHAAREPLPGHFLPKVSHANNTMTTVAFYFTQGSTDLMGRTFFFTPTFAYVSVAFEGFPWGDVPLGAAPWCNLLQWSKDTRVRLVSNSRLCAGVDGCGGDAVIENGCVDIH